MRAESVCPQSALFLRAGPERHLRNAMGPIGVWLSQGPDYPHRFEQIETRSREQPPAGREVQSMTYAVVSARQVEDQLARDSFPVETMFRFLGVDVRVLSANVSLVQHWAAMYGAFRAPPGPARITVRVHGPAEGPHVPGQVTIESDDVLRTWRGNEALMPPLATPPL